MNNYKLHQMKQIEPPDCTCCNAGIKETPEHVLYCKSVFRTNLREHIISRLLQWQRATEMNEATAAFIKTAIFF